MFNQDQVTPIKPNSRPIPPVNSDEDQTRPQGNPKSDKDFKKMVNSDSEKDKGKVASIDDKDEESTPSLFDLSAKKKPEKKEGPVFKSSLVSADRLSQAVDNVANKEETDSETEDFDTLFASLQGDEQATGQSEEIPQPIVPRLPDDPTAYAAEQSNLNALPKDEFIKDPAVLEEISKEAQLANTRQLKSKSNTMVTEAEIPTMSKEDKKLKADDRFAQENVDLAYVNPIQQKSSSDIQANVGQIAETPSSRFDALKEIVDRVTESIQTIQSAGKTETVVTLKYPPILEGSQINLTSFDSARKEFNIAFTNLTGPAKEFLDRRLTGDALTMALEQKGFVVHIITTSTLQETPIIQTETEQFARQEGRQGQQQQQQSQDQEEET